MKSYLFALIVFSFTLPAKELDQKRLKKEWQVLNTWMQEPAKQALASKIELETQDDIEDLEQLFEINRRKRLSRIKKRSPVASSTDPQIIDLDKFEQDLNKKNSTR